VATGHTYVFIDESGDAGFKVVQGSSQVFVLAAVIFQNREKIHQVEHLMAKLREEWHLSPDYEFHFSKESIQRKAEFCRRVCHSPFKVRAIVVDKSIIYPDAWIRKSPNRFYNFFSNKLLKHSFGKIVNAKIRIDGKMNRELKTYLQRQLNQSEKIAADIKFCDSTSTPMIQLADMIAGAIARAYAPEKKKHDEMKKILAPCLDNVWEFGKQK